MAKVNTWTGVSVDMQSALGAVKTITAVAKGATATVTATHDFVVGDYIVFDVQGMSQLNDKVYRVLSVSTTVSFVIEAVNGTSVNTTNWDTFTSGTCNKVTFGTGLNAITSWDGSGGESDSIDTTTIHSTEKTEIPGARNPITYSFSTFWDPTDTGLSALSDASEANTKRAFKFKFRNGTIAVFNGFVNYSGSPVGGAQDKVTSPGVVKVAKAPSYYAS